MPAKKSNWLPLDQAPLKTLGHLWCEELGDRTDIIGCVYASVAEQPAKSIRIASSPMAHGYNFTHWHPLPSRPQP